MSNWLVLVLTWFVKRCIVLGLLVESRIVLVRRSSVLTGAPNLRSMPVMKLWWIVLIWVVLDRLLVSMSIALGFSGVICSCRATNLWFRGG